MKERLKRLIEHLEIDYKEGNFETLPEHIKEFNIILEDYHKNKKHLVLSYLYYAPDDDEDYFGDISNEGKAKFRKLLRITKNILNQRTDNMKKTTQKSIVFFAALIFIIAILILAFIFPCPTNFQYNISKIVIALSASFFATFIDGFIEVVIPKFIKATGALAVFVILFFWNPADLVVYKSCNDEILKISGTIKDKITQKSIDNVLIIARGHSIVGSPRGESNRSGDFNIEVPYKANSQDLIVLVEFTKDEYKSITLQDTLRNLSGQYHLIELELQKKETPPIDTTVSELNNLIAETKLTNVIVILNWEKGATAKFNDENCMLLKSKTGQRYIQIPKNKVGNLYLKNGNDEYNIRNFKAIKDTFITPRY